MGWHSWVRPGGPSHVQLWPISLSVSSIAHLSREVTRCLQSILQASMGRIARRKDVMRTPKTINRILRSQEPSFVTDDPMILSWRCQFCGRRFTDRTELREHLVVERQRQAGFADNARKRGPDRSGAT